MSIKQSDVYRRWQRLKDLFLLETASLQPRLHALQGLTAVLPRRTSSAMRARCFQLAGFSVGEGTLIASGLRITGDGDLFARLIIGAGCSIEADCVFDLAEQITIGNQVTLGPATMLLTSTHELGGSRYRAGALSRAPVSLGAGAWLGARSVVLPGVHVGAGAVVEPGSVVNKAVADNTRVGGNPAVKLGVLSASQP